MVCGVAGIWQRKKRGGLKVLFAYEPKATYRPRLRFRRTIADSVKRHYAGEYCKAHDRAIATAR
jgi:hypothetical protein